MGKLLKTVINRSLLGAVFFLFAFTSIYADDDTTVGVAKGFDFNWFKIGTPIDLKNFGVLNFLGYLAAFLIFWMALYTMWLVVKVSWLYLKSRGDTGLVEQATETGRELMKGMLITFLWIGLYTLFSLFLGVGNMFRWGEALTQCGDGTPYFQAEYNARQILKENGLSFNDTLPNRVVSYCCEIPVLLQTVDVERGYSISPDENNIKILVNKAGDGSGWLFENTEEVAPKIEGCRVIFD